MAQCHAEMRGTITNKPVLFPGVVPPRISLSNFSGQHSDDVHKQDEVELKQKPEVEKSDKEKRFCYGNC